MKYFFSILIISLFISCNSSAEKSATESPKTTIAETLDSKADAKPNTSKETESGIYQFLTYKGATVLSKTTSYNFADGNGKIVNIQVSNNPEFAKIKIPSSLLSDDRTSANESLIGKKVEWIHDKKEKLVEIKIAK